MKKHQKQPVVYILASRRNGTLYIGVTSDLGKRLWQRKEGTFEGFSKEFQVNILVYFEMHKTMQAAILRERQLKKWNRKWKLRIIENQNPTWRDLTVDVVT
jgi:putative endonuclease